MTYYAVNTSQSLYHHGVKGMHWGVRRYQNKDGSLTPEGRAKYERALKFDSVKYNKTKLRNAAMAGAWGAVFMSPLVAVDTMAMYDVVDRACAKARYKVAAKKLYSEKDERRQAVKNAVNLRNNSIKAYNRGYSQSIDGTFNKTSKLGLTYNVDPHKSKKEYKNDLKTVKQYIKEDNRTARKKQDLNERQNKHFDDEADALERMAEKEMKKKYASYA